MQFIDLAAQQHRIRSIVEKRIQTVLNHGKYINGPEIPELEEKLSEFVGVPHAMGCSSGTDALLLALMALDIGPGDAVFTTPFTFIATAEVISLAGAMPVFVDIDPLTFNIDPAKLDQAVNALKSHKGDIHPLPVQAKVPDTRFEITPKAVIAVDLFGLPADYDRIMQVAEKHGLVVIEDAAQSLGAEYHGKKACSFGDIACASFFPAKPLGCYGDGGMCFTHNTELAARLKSLRNHGAGGHKYDNVRIGINGRLDAIQAAVLLCKFDIFPEEIGLRQEVAHRYSQMLSDTTLTAPKIPEGMMSVWAQYAILPKHGAARDFFQKALKDKDIPTAIYYPKPLHLQTAFKNLGYQPGDFPVSEDYSSRIFSIPMHPYLTHQDQELIVKTLSLT